MGLVQPRRVPLSTSLAQLRPGSTLGSAGAFRGIDSNLAARLRTEDPIAAGALRRLATSNNLLHGIEEWCLWLLDTPAGDFDRSPFLRDRLARVHRTRRRDQPPWAYENLRQPSRAYRAVPLRFPRELPRFLAYELGPDVIIDASAAAIDEEGSTTAGVIMSRPYRVWVDVLSRPDSPTSTITTNGVHNTFPLPELNDDQFEEIGRAADFIIMAARFAMTESIIEVYKRDQLPDAVQAGHDRLDALVCEVFGLPPEATDAEIEERLFDLYAELSSV